MARIAVVMRCIGRRVYQEVTLASLRRTAGFGNPRVPPLITGQIDGLSTIPRGNENHHTINVYAVYTPTKLVDDNEMIRMQGKAKLFFSSIVTVPKDLENINQSAGFAMNTLVQLAEKGEHDFYCYTEGDVLFTPDWLDNLLDLRQHVASQLEEGQKIGIGCPIDMPMDWYEPVERDRWWHKKWMAAQCYLMDAETALAIKLDDPIYQTTQPPSGWDKEMPLRLTEQGYVHFTPRGISWAQHIGYHGVTSNDHWRPLGVGFFPSPRIRDLHAMARAVSHQDIVEEYER